MMYAFLQLAVVIYSLSLLFAKAAGASDWLSARFFLLYGAMLVCLGIYALMWQPLLKRLPLSVAFCCKAVSVVWGMLGGALFFSEALTLRGVIGAVIVVIGIALIATERGGEKAA